MLQKRPPIRYIALAGLIGAGKTTMAKSMREPLQSLEGSPRVKCWFEKVENNKLLAAFYEDMKAHSFTLQISLLMQRHQQQQQINWASDHDIHVQDRSIYEDAIFAKMQADSGLMDGHQYKTYCEAFATVSKYMQQPDLIVFLDVSPETSIQRIRKRNRAMEKGITIEYVRDLHVRYRSALKDISKHVPVIRVPWDDASDSAGVARRLVKAWEEGLSSSMHTLQMSDGGDADPDTSPQLGDVGEEITISAVPDFQSATVEVACAKKK